MFNLTALLLLTASTPIQASYERYPHRVDFVQSVGKTYDAVVVHVQFSDQESKPVDTELGKALATQFLDLNGYEVTRKGFSAVRRGHALFVTLNATRKGSAPEIARFELAGFDNVFYFCHLEYEEGQPGMPSKEQLVVLQKMIRVVTKGANVVLEPYGESGSDEFYRLAGELVP